MLRQYVSASSWPLAALLLTAQFLTADDLHISPERIRQHIKYLASDELEGRGVGTRGETLATNYLASQLAAEGVKGGGESGTFFQTVPLVGSTTLPDAKLSVTGKGSPFNLAFNKEFVGTAASQVEMNDFDAEAIFVGHGISAPQYDWDDYKGMDVRGKVLVYFTNEPTSDDPKFFNGPSLTYFGRWTYKFEEATRRGAAAALIIHTTQTAGYGWGVVSNSNSQEKPQLKLEQGEHGLKLAAWVTEEAGRHLTAATGKSLDELLQFADQKEFRPMPLGIRIRGHVPVKLRSISSRNVVGAVAGSDGNLRSQAVLFTAHWDHLGVGNPVNGDRIYNGAVDNASGCAIVLEMARVWAAMPQKPRRSAIFLFVTAEESGLLGSQYFGDHPTIPSSHIAADINYDAVYPFGRTQDVHLTGAERTTIYPLVERAAQQAGFTIKPETEPGQGHYYRSDHFSLARTGIPAFSIAPGSDYVGKSPDYGKQIFENYNSKHYHQPSDEYQESWDFAGMEQVAQFGINLGMDIANTPELPTWKPGDEFLPAREKSLGTR